MEPLEWNLSLVNACRLHVQPATQTWPRATSTVCRAAAAAAAIANWPGASYCLLSGAIANLNKRQTQDVLHLGFIKASPPLFCLFVAAHECRRRRGRLMAGVSIRTPDWQLLLLFT